MAKHNLLSGEILEYEKPRGELADFVDRLRAAVDDPTITESAFIELLYSTTNPLLDKKIMPGRGTVTKAVFADPIYHLMLDLLGRKRVALGTLDMEKVRARYSMTVKEAAAAAGVHENAIRQAIAAKRLSSVKDKGEHRLDPAQVAAYKPQRGGPVAPLEVTVGAERGKSFSIRHDGEDDGVESHGTVSTMRVRGWTTATIISRLNEQQKVRAWRIESGPDPNEISFPPFEVRGRFTIVEQTNNLDRAKELFAAAPRETSGASKKPPATVRAGIEFAKHLKKGSER